MGLRIAVEYTVPVLCWVDVEEGTITSVSEHVELIAPTGVLIDADGERMPKDDGAFEVATQIADDNDWPVWDKGY